MTIRFIGIIFGIMVVVPVPPAVYSSQRFHRLSVGKTSSRWIRRSGGCSHSRTQPTTPWSMRVRGGEDSIKEGDDESFDRFLEDFARQMEEMRKDLLHETNLEMEQLKQDLLEKKRRQRQRQEDEEEEEGKMPTASVSPTTTNITEHEEMTEPCLSAQEESFVEEGVNNIQEEAIEKLSDAVGGISNEEDSININEEEEEVSCLNTKETEENSFRNDNDSEDINSKSSAEVVDIEDQDSTNELPVTGQWVELEEDESFPEIADGLSFTQSSLQEQRISSDSSVEDVAEETIQDGGVKHDSQALLKLQSSVKEKEYRKTKKRVSKSIKVQSTSIEKREDANDDEITKNAASTEIAGVLQQNNKIAKIAVVGRAIRVIGLVAIYIYIYINLLQALPPNSTTRFLVLALLTAYFHFQITKQFNHKS